MINPFNGGIYFANGDVAGGLVTAPTFTLLSSLAVQGNAGFNSELEWGLPAPPTDGGATPFISPGGGVHVGGELLGPSPTQTGPSCASEFPQIFNPVCAPILNAAFTDANQRPIPGSECLLAVANITYIQAGALAPSVGASVASSLPQQVNPGQTVTAMLPNVALNAGQTVVLVTDTRDTNNVRHATAWVQGDSAPAGGPWNVMVSVTNSGALLDGGAAPTVSLGSSVGYLVANAPMPVAMLNPVDIPPTSTSSWPTVPVFVAPPTPALPPWAIAMFGVTLATMASFILSRHRRRRTAV
jgi:hypothetical protein